MSKILIIDDTYQKENLPTDIFSKHDVEIVQTGEEAIEKVKRVSYSAILVDCRFTEVVTKMQGPSIAREIACILQDKGEDVPVVGFSPTWKRICAKDPEPCVNLEDYGEKEEVLKKLIREEDPFQFVSTPPLL